jgi:membrane protease YdiL (CAAX protease family)
VARGSGVLGKSYVLLPVVFGLAFLSACVVSPFVKVLNDELSKTRPLDKIFVNCLLAFALIYFVVFRRHMRSRVAESLNLRVSSVLTHLAAGLAAGAVVLCVIIAVFYAAGAKHYDANFAAGLIWRALLIGLGVGFLEEIVFRGVVLQNLQADMALFFAVVFASAFFAAMHFVKPLPDEILDLGRAPSFDRFHLLNGFRVVPYQLGAFSRLDVIWPFLLGLFLIGVALSVAYIKTGSLYLPIGIHAGFVAVGKLDGQLFRDVAGRSKLLFGVPHDCYLSYADSLVCWLATAAFTVLLLAFAGTLRPRASSGGKR